MKIVCIGVGAMGGSLTSAMCKNGYAKDVVVTAKNYENAKKFAIENGCVAMEKNADAVKNAKYVFIAVKPAAVQSVLEEIKDFLDKNAVVISMAAGVPLENLKKWSASHCIRIMPNLPAKISESMTGICFDDVANGDVEEVKKILETAGKVEIVDEKLMNCVTAVSGSGPAYVFMFIEALSDAAVRFGMSRKQAYIFASKTVEGSAKMVLKGEKLPAELKDEVCSPNGTTIRGVCALEKNGFRNAVIQAVQEAMCL